MNTTTDLQTLYRQTVLDHSRHPRNFRRLPDADASVVGHNPLCGDKITVHLKLGDSVIEDVAFEGVGCAISLASASIMTEQVEQKPLDEARLNIDRIMARLQHPDEEPEPMPGDMAALSGVRSYPSRVKCATLAWRTLLAALDGNQNSVTTEE